MVTKTDLVLAINLLQSVGTIFLTFTPIHADFELGNSFCKFL